MSCDFRFQMNRMNPCMSSIILVFLTIYLILEFIGVMVVTGTVATEGSTVVKEYNTAFHTALGYAPPKDVERTEDQPKEKLDNCMQDIVNHYNIVTGPDNNLPNISITENSADPANLAVGASNKQSSSSDSQNKKFKEVRMYIFNGINFFVVASFWFCIFRTFDKSWCTYLLVSGALIYALVLILSNLFDEERNAHNKILELVHLQSGSIKLLWLIPLTALWIIVSKKMEIPRTNPQPEKNQANMSEPNESEQENPASNSTDSF